MQATFSFARTARRQVNAHAIARAFRVRASEASSAQLFSRSGARGAIKRVESPVLGGLPPAVCNEARPKRLG
jgi:hypothetical protein